MHEDTCTLKRSALNLCEELSVLEQDWLSGCLVSNVGVQGAIYSDQDPAQLVVEYDAKLINNADLLRILCLWGLWAELGSAERNPLGISNC
jgi:hypothetical protein